MTNKERITGYLLAIPVNLPISSTRIRFSHHMVVELTNGKAIGIGEGVLYRGTLYQTGEIFTRVVRPTVEENGWVNWPEHEQVEWLAQLADISSGWAYALDSAWCDLRARSEGKRVADLLGGVRRTQIPITEQVFIRSWPDTEAELDAILRRGTRRIKVKIGLNPSADLENVRRVRAFVGPAVELRVDANRAYRLDEALPLCKQLADSGVLALEEPLAGQNWEGLRMLREKVGLPIMLDENIRSLSELQTAIRNQAVDVLNLKLTRLGGPRLALKYARLCDEAGVEVALGCTEELGVGMATILHVAAALPALHSVEGVGPLRLGFDITPSKWNMSDGTLALPEQPGLGVQLRQNWQREIPRHVHRFSLPSNWPLYLFSKYARWFQCANSLMWRIHRARRI